MDNSQKPAQSFIQRISRKRWVRVCSVLVLLATVFLLVLPHAVRIGLERWLLNNGADQATVSSIKINLFSGTASIHDLNVIRNDKTVLGDSEISLNIALYNLLTKQAIVQQATLRNIVMDLEMTADGSWRIGTISLPAGGSEEEEQSPDKTTRPWFFGARTVEITDATVHLAMPDLDLTLQVDRAVLTKFSNDPAEKSGTFFLKGTLNQAPLELQLDTLRIAPDLEMAGTIKASGLVLDDLADLLKDAVAPFSGKGYLDGTCNFRMTEKQGLQVGYSGLIRLEQAEIGGTAYGVKGAEVSWDGTVKYNQSPAIDINIDLDGTLQGERLALKLPDSDLTLLQDSLELSGTVTVAIDEQVSVQHTGTIQFGATDFSMPDLQARHQSLSWSGTSEYLSSTTRVETDGRLILEEPAVILRDNMTVGGDALAWQGLINFTGPAASQTGSTLRLKGLLNGTSLMADLPDNSLAYSQEQLKADCDLTLPLDNLPDLQGKAGLEAAMLRLMDTDRNTPLVSLDSLTVADVTAPGDGGLSVVKTALKQLVLASPTAAHLELSVAEITAHQTTVEDMQRLAIQDFNITGVLARDTTEDTRLGSIEALTLSGLHADKSQQVGAESFQLDEARLLEELVDGRKTDVLHLAGVTAEQPEWSPENGLEIDNINLASLNLRLVKDPSGDLLFLRDLKALLKELIPVPESESPEPQPADSADFALKIGRIATSAHSTIRFEDRSLKHPYVLEILIEDFRVDTLDSAHPEQAIPYTLKGALDKYAFLQIKGTVNPFGDDFFLEQTGVIKNYPMAQLAPYSIQYLGIVPTQGTLNVNTTISIKDKTLDLQKTWLFKKLQVKTLEEDLAAEFESQLPLPLDSALALLRDKHDNIELKMPISGPLNDLEFNITNLFITPLSKAIVTATSSYLVFTLGPYGAAAYVGYKIGEILMETRVPPVIFAQGEVDLDAAQKDYLKRVADVLENRPALDMELCARVLPSEHLPDQKREQQDKASPAELTTEEKNILLDLGRARTITVKDYLIKEYDIDPGRLIICLPELDREPDAEPRVELKF